MSGSHSLAQQVAYLRHETRHGQVVGVAVGHGHIPYHHGKTCSCLSPLVPFLFAQLRFGYHVDTHLGRIHGLCHQHNLVFVQFLVLHLVVVSLAVLDADDEAL